MVYKTASQSRRGMLSATHIHTSSHRYVSVNRSSLQTHLPNDSGTTSKGLRFAPACARQSPTCPVPSNSSPRLQAPWRTARVLHSQFPPSPLSVVQSQTKPVSPSKRLTRAQVPRARQRPTPVQPLPPMPLLRSLRQHRRPDALSVISFARGCCRRQTSSVSPRYSRRTG